MTLNGRYSWVFTYIVRHCQGRSWYSLIISTSTHLLTRYFPRAFYITYCPEIVHIHIAYLNRGAMALPDFGRSINPISTGPDFQTFLHPWVKVFHTMRMRWQKCKIKRSKLFKIPVGFSYYTLHNFWIH